jgi:ATP-dependent phosphofructokinase / diphosphate-dependent phosphofructokinase
MSTGIGSASSHKRIAIMMGAGYVPGMNAVITGTAVAASNLGWETVGIRDGLDGLLYPERYPEGGLVPLDPQLIENLDPAGSGVLGQSGRVDPFHVRQVDEDGCIQEADLSDVILERLKAERIDALVAVVGGRGMSIFHKLHRKGLNAVCIPRSIENDIAATSVSFGFNTALTFTIEMLDRVRQAAQSARKIGVVEVLGAEAGWLTLQSGIAARADAVLIPEIPCDLRELAARLKQKITTRRPYGLVVVAEGAKFVNGSKARSGREAENPLKATLSPLATDETGDKVIHRSGKAAETVAQELQLLLAEETIPMVLGPWIRGGTPSSIDRQLALVYGAAAVKAVEAGKFGVMTAFSPPEIQFTPLLEAINKVRTVPVESEFLQVARSLGIFVGREL